MRDKKGIMGVGIITIYHLVLVTLVAVVIFGVSSIFYNHYIDVKDSEARILAREVVECVTPTFNLDTYPSGKGILDYCGFENRDLSRFFVKVSFFRGIWDDDAQLMIKIPGSLEVLSQGDSGALWLRKLFDSVEFKEGEAWKYRPGYYKESYDGYLIKNSEEIVSKIEVEVFVQNEE